MPACDNCDEHVTAAFARVFRVEGVVHTCPNCVSNTVAGLPQAVIARTNPDRMATGEFVRKRDRRGESA